MSEKTISGRSSPDELLFPPLLHLTSVVLTEHLLLEELFSPLYLPLQPVSELVCGCWW